MNFEYSMWEFQGSWIEFLLFHPAQPLMARAASHVDPSTTASGTNEDRPRSGAPGLRVHPRSGASWEGFALEQVLRLSQPDEAWFWATHGGAELDLMMVRGGRRIGIEFKRSDAPKLSRSMGIAFRDLSLDALYVVYPGNRRYPLAERIEAVPLGAFV
ncbi:MAG: DUF4143 domain-containing protein [Burkholderiaceae bacterium]